MNRFTQALSWMKQYVPTLSIRRTITEIITPGHPVQIPRNFASLADEGFEQNLYCYRSIELIAQSVAGIPWLLYKKIGPNKNERLEIDTHEVLSLLDYPNPDQGHGEFFEELVAFWVIAGNSYMNAIGPKTRSRPPQELYVLSPSAIEVVPGESGRVNHYKVKYSEQEYSRAELLHLKMFSALDSYYGLSPLAVASHMIDAVKASDLWNLQLLQNSARPSGAFVYKDGKLEDEQYRRLQLQQQEMYASYRNAGRAMILEGGVDWRQMSLGPTDMDWLSAKIQQGREIGIALGVPPELIGDSRNATYGSFDIARRSFYTETVLPVARKLRDRLNVWLLPRYGETSLYLDLDLDQIEAIQDDRSQVWQRVTSAWLNGLITLNEARRAIGYEDIIGGNVFVQDSAFISLRGSDRNAFIQTTIPSPDVPANSIQAREITEGVVNGAAANMEQDQEAIAKMKPRLTVLRAGVGG